MILGGLFAVVAQVVVPAAKDRSVEERVQILAAGEARNRTRLSFPVYDDPNLRAQIRRVGLPAGCAAVNHASKEVLDQYGPTIEPFAVEAIRKVVPARALEKAYALSFIAYPLVSYSGRVKMELDELAAEPIARARADTRKRLTARLANLPAAADDQGQTPKEDIARALNLGKKYDLENSAQLGLACAELLIRPRERPQISTGGKPSDR